MRILYTVLQNFYSALNTGETSSVTLKWSINNQGGGEHDSKLNEISLCSSA